MLLFSTTLEIKDTLTKDKFIELIIQWNQSSPYEENIISDIDWNGERNIRFGKDNLWLDIEEYRNENIIAVRYEKIEQDGIIWDTDYVVNFTTMKIAVQLYRSYKEEAVVFNSSFSAPHFITVLIENGYLKRDGELPILREPIYVTEKNIIFLSEIINQTKKFRLPIVYVSKTVYDYDPVNVNWLASRLKGVAHVLVEKSKQLNNSIRKLCDDKNEYNGGIGVYYPNHAVKHKRFLYRKYVGSDEILLNKVVINVIQYVNSQNIDSLYTWQGVNNSLLNDRFILQKKERQDAENARAKAENEVSQVFDAFDDDLTKLQQHVEELTRTNEVLRYENQGLRSKLNSLGDIPILKLGDEDEFYQGEIKDIILSTLENVLNGLSGKSRKADVIKDIIENNNYEHLSDERKQKIKKILKSYNGMNGQIRQQLQELGFEITEEGKHYKLTYFGDGRYWTTLGKTPGDGRNGKNLSAEIVNGMM